MDHTVLDAGSEDNGSDKEKFEKSSIVGGEDDAGIEEKSTKAFQLEENSDLFNLLEGDQSDHSPAEAELDGKHSTKTAIKVRIQTLVELFILFPLFTNSNSFIFNFCFYTEIAHKKGSKEDCSQQ